MSQKGNIMAQIHKKFTVDQVKVLFSSYEVGHISRSEIENTLGIGKTRFFALLKQFRNQSDSFSIAYQRHAAHAKRHAGLVFEEITPGWQHDSVLSFRPECSFSF